MRTRMTGSDEMRALLSAKESRAFLLTKTYMEAGYSPGTLNRTTPLLGASFADSAPSDDEEPSQFQQFQISG